VLVATDGAVIRCSSATLDLGHKEVRVEEDDHSPYRLGIENLLQKALLQCQKHLELSEKVGKMHPSIYDLNSPLNDTKAVNLANTVPMT
jgi:hypothetical protein